LYPVRAALVEQGAFSEVAIVDVEGALARREVCWDVEAVEPVDQGEMVEQ